MINILKAIKRSTISNFRKFSLGNRIYHNLIWLKSGEAKVDYNFPEVINIETASTCNLKCFHCPNHTERSSDKPRVLGTLTYDRFEKIMDEIDSYGERRLSLHKDGEPLLNKDIIKILDRVTKYVNHTVYLTTNGHLLSDEISRQILKSKISILNISLGAISQDMYKKIRGGEIERVLKNVDHFLKLKKEFGSDIRVLVQIIDLNELDMKGEIEKFKSYWQDKDVSVEIWDELTWGVGDHKFTYRYPCFSLWESFNINSDGKVSGCCMDWNQSIIIGDIFEKSIKEIWDDKRLKAYRKAHMENRYEGMDLCKNCNFWRWQPMLKSYRVE